MNKIRTNAKLMAGFIPHRLDISDKPELSDFPLNILFGNFITINGVDMSATALYEPELNTFQCNGDEKSLTYKNIYGMGTLTVTKRNDGWGAIKTINNKFVRLTHSKDWKMFFVTLTGPGLCNGEGCFYKTVSSKDSLVN